MSSQRSVTSSQRSNTLIIPIDINECSRGTHQCASTSTGGVCDDIDGSYMCSCRSGYSGNGIVLGQTVGEQFGTDCAGECLYCSWGSKLCNQSTTSMFYPLGKRSLFPLLAKIYIYLFLLDWHLKRFCWTGNVDGIECWWFSWTRSLVAVEPRRPPMHMTDVGTETAFRLDQRKHFQKSKHLLRSEVSWCDQTCIDLHLRRSTCTIE